MKNHLIPSLFSHDVFLEKSSHGTRSRSSFSTSSNLNKIEPKGNTPSITHSAPSLPIIGIVEDIDLLRQITTFSPTAAPSYDFSDCVLGWFDWIFTWGNPDTTSTNPEIPDVTPDAPVLDEFTAEYEVDLGTYDALLDVDSMSYEHDSTMVGMLNADASVSDTIFRSFETKSTDQRSKNRRKANAKGVCLKKKCDVPSSYAFPSKKILDVTLKMTEEEYALLEGLRNTPYEHPVPEYTLVVERDESGATYSADYQPVILAPWTNFTVSMTLVNFSTAPLSSPCKVSENECGTQRSAIESVFDVLQLEYSPRKHECFWEGIKCNDLNLIISIQICKFSLCLLSKLS